MFAHMQVFKIKHYVPADGNINVCVVPEITSLTTRRVDTENTCKVALYCHMYVIT